MLPHQIKMRREQLRIESAGNDLDQSSRTVERTPSTNPNDIVLFDGEKYIKKSGWKVPSYDDTWVNESYQLHNKPLEEMTENGKKVKTNVKQYVYKTPPKFTEDFNFKGNDLEYLKGVLERAGFLESRVNGKVFMYSVYIVTTWNGTQDAASNQYQIQDRDGDGIFETLLGDYDEIIVPNWVLK